MSGSDEPVALIVFPSVKPKSPGVAAEATDGNAANPANDRTVVTVVIAAKTFFKVSSCFLDTLLMFKF